ncbi:MAG: M23 family metallopeptidase, partial [Eubacterium sp.]|nr:M23 family metallopeptidase [Eubacterium sp.]
SGAFSTNAVKERIERIMKAKKPTIIGRIAASMLVAAAMAVFVSAKTTDVIYYTIDESGQHEISAKEAEVLSEESDYFVYRIELDGENGIVSQVEPKGTTDDREAIAVSNPGAANSEKTEIGETGYALPLADMTEEPDYEEEYQFFPADQNSAVHSIADGEVVYAEVGHNRGYGNVVVVKHEDDLYVTYAHLAPENGIAVQSGETVQAGETIGYAGSSGWTNGIGVGLRCTDTMLEYENDGYVWKNSFLPTADAQRQLEIAEEGRQSEDNENNDYIRPTENVYIVGRYN